MDNELVRSRSFSGHRPFRGLKRLVEESEIVLAPETDKALAPAAPRVAAALTDDEAFALGMEGVRPLGWSATPLELPPSAPVTPRRDAGDDDDALAELAAFVGGRGELDPFAAGEGVEGASSRRGRRYLARLKRGDFSVQAQLDLHGLDCEDAQLVLETFLRRSVARGYGCVRVVHGRGRHSRSSAEPGTMKRAVTRWLSSRRLSRVVIAFASAPWRDGGGGAVYVLLCGKWRPPRA